jgi:uncharacterized membrane-anchored protein
VRIETSARALVKRLRPGDIAVINRLDLDTRTAQALVDTSPAAVINIQMSLSGRYPAGGAGLIARAGIPLVDAVGADVLELRDGAKVTVDAGQVRVKDRVIARGDVLTVDEVEQRLASARQGLHVQLAEFASNALDVVKRESSTLLDRAGLPDLGVELTGKHVLVVGDGPQVPEQLTRLKRYIREHRPVVLAVGQAADAVVAAKLQPRVIVGAVDAVSEAALAKASLAVLIDAGTGAPGTSRAEALRVSHATVRTALADEDLALVLASANDAAVIVTVGVESGLVGYLEQDSPELAGTFLARLRAGGAIVDADVLARVYRHGLPAMAVVLMVMLGVAALVIAILATPEGRDALGAVSAWVASLVSR